MGMGMDGRSPLSPLSLADLVGNANAAAHAAHAGFAGLGGGPSPYYQPPAMGYVPGLSGVAPYFEPHDASINALQQHQQQEAAAAAAIATAHSLGLHHPPPSAAPAMHGHPMVPPPPPAAAAWNMATSHPPPPPTWSPSPAPQASATAPGFGGAPQLGGSPGTPMNFQGLSPGASPNPPMIMHSPTPSPGQEPRLPAGLGPVGFPGPLAVAGEQNGVCDLESRLKNLDVVVRDLAAEARGFTAVATVGAPVGHPGVVGSGTTVVGGEVAMAPALAAAPGAENNKVLHRI